MLKKTFYCLPLALILCALPALAAAFTVDISSDKSSYSPGENIAITVHAYDGSHPIDNPSRKKIVIKEESGNRLVSTNMSNNGNGYFSYNYKIADNPVEGLWSLKAVFEDDGSTVRETIFVDVAATSGGG